MTATESPVETIYHVLPSARCTATTTAIAERFSAATVHRYFAAWKYVENFYSSVPHGWSEESS